MWFIALMISLIRHIHKPTLAPTPNTHGMNTFSHNAL